MQLRLASIVAFYQPDGKILIQDRRNIPKDAIEWSFFGGGVEGSETFLQCAIREIQEELRITLTEKDLVEIGHTTVELAGIARTEIHVFVSPWKSLYDGFEVFEGAGYQWATLDEMKKLFIYPINYPQISLLERYFFLV